MQTIHLILNQSIPYFRERLLPSAIDKKIALIACTALLCLAGALLAIHQAFKKPSLLGKTSPENAANKNLHHEALKKEENTADSRSISTQSLIPTNTANKTPVNPPQIEENIQFQKGNPPEPKNVSTQPDSPLESPTPTREEAHSKIEDPSEKLLADLGAEKFVANLSVFQMNALVQKWQKEDRTLIKLSQLFQDVFIPSDNDADLEASFQFLFASVINSDLNKLLSQGGAELKIVCLPEAIVQILRSNDSLEAKEKQLENRLNNYYDLYEPLLGLSKHMSDPPQQQAIFKNRSENFIGTFCCYIAEHCPSTEVGTLLKAYSKYGFSCTMRQLFGFSLISQVFESKDLTRIGHLMSAYWTCWKIMDHGGIHPNLCLRTLLEIITSEEILKVVRSSIPDSLSDDEKEEIENQLGHIKFPIGSSTS